MNLRSGASTEKVTTVAVRKKSANKHFATPASTMAEMAEIKHLMLEMKESLSKAFKDFRMDFKEFRAETEKDIKMIMQQTAELRCDLNKTSDRLEQVERQVGETQDTEILHHKTINYLVKKVSDMEECTEYLENKSRQNNVGIFNIPEKNEGNSMIAFLKKLFNEVLKIPGDFDIIRAHRIYREGKDQIRPIIVAFLNFETKKQILHVAWGTKK